uniref:Putative LOV domain-containing protein n=1 Tax=Sargassum thunbergii TaxID=127542 RepID=A0A126X4A9_9PHAE|nr:putative LOV domain-containing protein [Sargassum thunbergii]
MSPVAMGLGGIGMPMPCLAPTAGIPSAEKLSAAPVMPGAPGVSMLAARAEGMLAASRQETNKRRRDETRDQKKFTEQIVRRRERNRILAKQTRLRKKFFYQSLQKRLATLRAENKTLKSVLTERMGERAKQVVYDCTSELSRQIIAGTVETGEDVDAEIEGMGGEGGKGNAGTPTKILARPDFNLVKSLQLAQQIFVVTEPSLPDNPIVYASAGFLKLTGYKIEQVVGRNCRFLQGPDTDKQSVAIIRQAIGKGEDAHVNLINYKADGTPFWNNFFVAALRDENNRIMNYVGTQCPIPGPLPPFRRKTDASLDLVNDKRGGGGKDGGSSGGGGSGGGTGGGGGGDFLRQSGSEVDSQHEDTGNDGRGTEGGDASDVHAPPEEKGNIVGEVLGKVLDGCSHADTSSLDRGDRSSGESVDEIVGGKSREARLLETPGVAVMTAADTEIKAAEAAGNSLQFLKSDKGKSFGSRAFAAQNGVQVETIIQ